MLEFLEANPAASRLEIANKLGGITPDGVKYNLARLQKLGFLKREGPDFGGRWKVLEAVGTQKNEN